MENSKLNNQLREYWPNLFVKKQKAKPLKIGIKDDLLKDIEKRGIDFPEDSLCTAIQRYVRTIQYLFALIHEPHRYNLDGESCGVVTDSEREIAKIWLKRRKSKAAKH